MPHAVIEYSDNLAAEFQSGNVVQAVHNTLLESGLFGSHDIKTRAIPVQDFLVGDKGKQGRFAHVTVFMLEGRTLQQKQALSQALLDKVGVLLKNADSTTIDIRELVRDTYRKR